MRSELSSPTRPAKIGTSVVLARIGDLLPVGRREVRARLSSIRGSPVGCTCPTCAQPAKSRAQMRLQEHLRSTPSWQARAERHAWRCGTVPWLDHRMTEPHHPGDPPPTPAPPATDVVQRTSMAAERTWLAWWRTALAATVGSLAVGRLSPELLDVAPWPYVVLGAGYAGLAVGLLVIGARRQRDLQRALDHDSQAPLSFGVVTLFTVGGVMLALTTVVLVLAQA